MQDDDDEKSIELLERFLDGDREAFGELYARHEQAVRAFVWTTVKRADESRLDDLCSKTWLEVMKSAKRWSRRSTFRTWLLGVAKNIALMDLRGRKRDGRVPADDDERSDPEADHERRAALVADLEAALETLPPQERDVLRRKHEKDCTFAELSEETGVPEQTLKDRFQRGLRKIAPRLKAWTPWRKKGNTP